MTTTTYIPIIVSCSLELYIGSPFSSIPISAASLLNISFILCHKFFGNLCDFFIILFVKWIIIFECYLNLSACVKKRSMIKSHVIILLFHITLYIVEFVESYKFVYYNSAHRYYMIPC